MQARTASSPGQVPCEMSFDLPTRRGGTTAPGIDAGSGAGRALCLQRASEENPCNNRSYHLNKSQIFHKQRTGLNVPNKLLILNYHLCSNNS